MSPTAEVFGRGLTIATLVWCFGIAAYIGATSLIAIAKDVIAFFRNLRAGRPSPADDDQTT